MNKQEQQLADISHDVEVQNTAEEDQVHRRTFMSLICLERDFREFAIYTLEDCAADLSLQSEKV
eukprot:2951979-Amphidinium_carterae.1